jgi:hypothetical protein
MRFFFHHMCHIHNSKYANIFLNTRTIRDDILIWKKENIQKRNKADPKSSGANDLLYGFNVKLTI